MRKLDWVLIAPLLMWTVNAKADILDFGTVDDFESQAVGSQPTEFTIQGGFDATTRVRASGHDGVNTTQSLGGSRFVEFEANPSYRITQFGNIGSQQSLPTGGQYSIFVDLYTQSAPNATGTFRWRNTVNNVNTGDQLAEAAFEITPGETQWKFTADETITNFVNLDADTWYTMEVLFDTTTPTLSATYKIFNQGQRLTGSALFTHADTSLTSVDSANVGGPRYSYFGGGGTAWADSTVSSIYIDNIGTSGPAPAPAPAAVPEPSSMTLLGLMAAGGLGTYWRRKRASRLA